MLHIMFETFNVPVTNVAIQRQVPEVRWAVLTVSLHCSVLPVLHAVIVLMFRTTEGPQSSIYQLKLVVAAFPEDKHKVS